MAVIFFKGMEQTRGHHSFHTMEQAFVPYYGTRLVPYPSGRYGTSLRSILWNKCRSIPCAIERLSSPAAIFRAILYLPNPVPFSQRGMERASTAANVHRALSFLNFSVHANHTRSIPVPYPFHTQDSPGAEQDSPSPEATTNPSKQQTAGETVKPGAKQDSPGAVPYLSICAGMEQAFVPYYGTRLVPYPSGRYGTSLRSILWNKACANGQPWDKVKKFTAI